MAIIPDYDFSKKEKNFFFITFQKDASLNNRLR